MYNEVVVVEGKNDKARLLAIFPNLNVITTNGSEISEDTLELIKKMSLNHPIILFLDPDYPGERIRSKILEKVPNSKHVFIEKSKAIDYKKHKVGVEHATKKDIIEALEHSLTYKKDLETITFGQLFELGLLGGNKSQLKRIYLSKKLHLGSPNGKTLLKRLNALSLTSEEVREILNDQDWDS